MTTPKQLAICLCTFNPRIPVLEKVIRSVATQNCDPSLVQFLLIDNASNPAIPASTLAPLVRSGFTADIIREEKSGIFHARNRGMRATATELILWIDDDTELPAGYISQCLAIATHNPGIGCFGGRLLAGPDCRYPAWCIPFLPYLAIIDRGHEVISGSENHWGPWEPPTAGAVVRRAVINKYLEFVAALPPATTIGQIGSVQLLRGEDSLLMRMAHRTGLQCSYQPSLQLWHHLDNHRFQFRYLLRLFYGYGRSFVILEKLLGHPLPRMRFREAWQYVLSNRKLSESENWRMFLAYKAWNIGFIKERGRGEF